MLLLAVIKIKKYAIKITSNGAKKNPLVRKVTTKALFQPVEVLRTEDRIPNDHDITMAEYRTATKKEGKKSSLWIKMACAISTSRCIRRSPLSGEFYKLFFPITLLTLSRQITTPTFVGSKHIFTKMLDNNKSAHFGWPSNRPK